MKHVIAGAGPVGCAAAAALARRGEAVVLVSRHRPTTLPEGVHHHAGDVLDPATLDGVLEGAATLVQCLNAPYHRWAERFPPLQDAIVAAAQRHRVHLISFENLYAYGQPTGTPFAEDAPLRPCSRKGEVRAAMIRQLQGLDLAVTHVRASDLFGPGMHASQLGDEILGRLLAGKGARGVGDLEAPHTWTYVPDAGETIAAVATHPDRPQGVFHVPSDAPCSQRAVVERVGELRGVPARISSTPRWLLWGLGRFVPMIGELVEMTYEFEAPFVLGDTRARTLLGVEPTPFDQALAHTLATWEAA